MNDRFKKIRAYRCGWLLQLTDWLCIMPMLIANKLRTTTSLEAHGLEHVTPRFWPSKKPGHLFLTNHRDIVMDAAYLSLILRTKKNIRPFMGIGNNLFGKWWIEPFVRLNRCFVVIRDSLGMHEQIRNSQLLSEYIRERITCGQSVWLAQRQGRAKDSNDRTQASIIKMLVMSGDKEQDILARIRELNITPICINYEYDPCDYLKAQEMQLKRDNPAWKKQKADDILSMKTGIQGHKGRVVYNFTPSLNEWIDQHEAALRALPRKELIDAICHQIDRQIHLNYEDYKRDEAFEEYLWSRLKLIHVPNKDDAFLLMKMHEMYANPDRNKFAAQREIIDN